MTNIVRMYVLYIYDMTVRDICCITYVSVEIAFDELYTCGMIRTAKEKYDSDMSESVLSLQSMFIRIFQID